jgi:hypothetical protein
MRIKVNIRPKDGRYFLEKDGTKFSSATWAGVIKRVTMYRKLNKFPLGNVEEDVMNQACQRLPSLCYNEGTQQAYPKKPPPSLKGRVMGWLAKLSKIFPAYVGPKKAAARAEVCIRCPQQGPMEKGCATCKATVKELRAANLRGRKADQRLMCCNVLGMDNQVAVWIDSDRLNDPGLPDHCWRKVQ